MDNPRKSRYLLALAIVVALGWVIFNGLSSADGTLQFGPHSPASRISGAMVEKNVRNARPAMETKNHSGPASVTYTMGTEGFEDSAANLVSSIVADYRAFDTMGEVMVLFAAVTGFLLLLDSGKKKKKMELRPNNFVFATASKIIFSFSLLTGVYISFNGHLTPGGGFAGGAVIATGTLILLLSGDSGSGEILHLLESLAGLLFIAVGIAGLVKHGSFLQNVFMRGALGNFFSSGIVLALNLIIGLKVGSELSSLLLGAAKKEA